MAAAELSGFIERARSMRQQILSVVTTIVLVISTVLPPVAAAHSNSSMNTAVNWTAIRAPVGAEEMGTLCRVAAFIDGTLRTSAGYWVAVGVSPASIFAVLDENGALQNEACAGTLTPDTRTRILTSFNTKIAAVIAQFGAASGVPAAKLDSVFWRSTEAELGRLGRLCGGGADAQGIVDFLQNGGPSNGGPSIDIVGRPAFGVGEVLPILQPGSQFSTGASAPCTAPSPAGGGGGSGGGANSGYNTWIWGQSYSASSAPTCFDSATSGNTCSPWAGPTASFPDTPAGRAAKNEANATTLVLQGAWIVTAYAAGVACAATAACGVGYAIVAGAIFATAEIALAVKAYEDNMEIVNSPGQYCPILGGSPVATLRSPSGVGPLGEHDALEMCGKKCDVNTGANCIGINSKISCNYNPIASNSYPIEYCQQQIATDNPWMLWGKIQAEVCGRMSCPLNTFGSPAPTGQCVCGQSGSGGGGVPINWNCFRILCNPLGQSCAWGC